MEIVIVMAIWRNLLIAISKYESICLFASHILQKCIIVFKEIVCKRKYTQIGLQKRAFMSFSTLKYV